MTSGKWLCFLQKRRTWVDIDICWKMIPQIFAKATMVDRRPMRAKSKRSEELGKGTSSPSPTI
jgi:hypothetical protein